MTRAVAIMRGLDSVPEPPATAKSAVGRIVGLTHGVLSGTIASDAPDAIAQIVLTANGRPISLLSVTWSSDLVVFGAIATRRGAFAFDTRQLPPDLLLDARLRFEIKLRTTPSTVLDTMEIETARLFPIGEVPRGQGRLEGYVDGTEGGTVRGWLWDPTNPQRRIKLYLFIGAAFCGTYEAFRLRPDLQGSGRGDGGYGFTISARDFFAKAASPSARVQIVSAGPEFWHVPFAPHTRPPRRRLFTLPKIRHIPATTRDLVAILTGAEPFPKKIYVIDRLTRTMPDAFSADYVLLAMEFLRVEMVKLAEPPATSWGQRLTSWSRQRAIRAQIRRLRALAEAAATTQSLLTSAARRPGDASAP